jgi:osmotically inducible protein OsmC
MSLAAAPLSAKWPPSGMDAANRKYGAASAFLPSGFHRVMIQDVYAATSGVFMKRSASAVWQGGLKDGKGSISTQSGALSNTQYSFGARFEEGVGTNPEELIGAAHAGCFTMALSGQLEKAGIKATSLRTTATVTLEKNDAGFAITAVHLDVLGKIPGDDRQAFETAAANAKAGCPVSKVLNAKITMDARLE